MSSSAATRYSLFCIAALVVTACAITHQSLWIDEGNTAFKALQPSLGAWWATFVREKGSDLQMPGYMLFVWGWEKIFGASEIALRAANVPFFVGGTLALAWGISKKRILQTAVVLLTLTNAFLWYYLSEARPYIVLFAFSAVTAACLVRLAVDKEEALHSALWFRLFCLGIVGLCLTSLIAVPWALGAMAAALYWSGWRRTIGSVARHKVAAALTVAVLGGLALYYLWTMQLGARASGVGRTDWINVAFIFYELFGIGGLGPGRLELRTQTLRAISSYLPGIAAGAMAVGLLLGAGLVSLKNRLTRGATVFYLLAVALPFGLVLAAGATDQMRLLGRHLTPLLPYLLALMGVGAAALFRAGGWKKAGAALALAVFFASALEIRFASRHRRDDYRSAAGMAREAVASGKRVWWLADISTAQYYRVPLESPQVVTSTDPKTLGQPPALVIFSKPDVYDGSGAARSYLQQNGFKVTKVLPAFEILQRPPGR